MNTPYFAFFKKRHRNFGCPLFSRVEPQTRWLGVNLGRRQKCLILVLLLCWLGVEAVAAAEIQEWLVPWEKSRPRDPDVGPDGRIWFVETGPNPNILVGFDSRTASYFSQDPIPSGGGAVRNMVFDAKTNALWFGTDSNYLGVVDRGRFLHLLHQWRCAGLVCRKIRCGLTCKAMTRSTVWHDPDLPVAWEGRSEAFGQVICRVGLLDCS